MTILSTELKFYKSKTVSDASGNGGRMSKNQIISGVLQNVFPHVFKAERTSGSIKYRKVYCKVANDDDETLFNGQLFIDGPTDADDFAVFFAATQRNTQNDITGSERIYGAGTLKTDVSAGGSTVIVVVEDTSIAGMFQDGDTIRISDKPTPDSGIGNEEFHTIDGAPSVSGDEVTVTIVGTLANDYEAATPTKIASVYEFGDVECSFDNWVENLSGSYDESTYPPILDNLGTVEQTWTLTFTDSTNFTLVGDELGSVGSGTVGSDFSPQNDDFSKPYLTIEAAGWDGTQQADDTIVFQTHPAAIPVWEKREVPAGADSIASNKIVLVFLGESA